MKKCAFLSMDDFGDLECHDHLVEPHLNQLGWNVETFSWRKPNVDWNQYEQVIIRSTWDYPEDPEGFVEVLKTIEASSAKLENSLEMIRWNMDKIYLKELEEQEGLPVIPTLWHDRLGEQKLDKDDVSKFFDKWKTDQLIIKPRISASAGNTFWLKSRDDEAKQQETLQAVNEVFVDKDFMVQPFVPAIVEEGEFSLFYINGKLSHTMQKKPQADDFRVQEEHGGQNRLLDEPEPILVKSAEACMLAIQKLHHEMPLYARMDLVRYEGQYVLMEVELIEPSMYFNIDKDSSSRFANGMVDRASAKQA